MCSPEATKQVRLDVCDSMSCGKPSTLHIHRHIDMEGMLTFALGNCVLQVSKP